MKPYLLSLGAGLLVGAIYGLLNVRSPAPPAIALLGLLGILIGEQAVANAQRFLGREPAPSRSAPPAPAHSDEQRPDHPD
jgi:XapX domain-containing protein